VIGLNTISAVHGRDRAEEMLLRLVDERGAPRFEHRGDLYSPYQIAALQFAVKLQRNAHDVTDEDFAHLRALCRARAGEQIAASLLSHQPESNEPAFLEAYVNGMLVEMTWCIVHFAGLLNAWFTVLKVMDETDAAADGIDFVSLYNQIVPESLKARNNHLLGARGWGD
jgi:hypothetical protein